MNYVIICTVGRSGSTLLQGILNGIDGYCIRGENDNFLFGLYMSYYSLLTCSTIEKGTSSIHPWYGSDIFDLDQFINDSRKIVINQFRFPRGIKTAGFKEIRWTSPYLHGKYLHDYLEFINLIFKDVKFIFLTRDLHEIYESQVRAGFGTQEKGYDYFSEHVIDFYEKMRSSNLPIFEIDYKDITFLSEKMVSMFEFLDADYNVDRIRSIISTEHSFANAKKFTSTALVPSTLLSTAAPTQPPERSADYTGIELEVGGTVVRIGVGTQNGPRYTLRFCRAFDGAHLAKRSERGGWRIGIGPEVIAGEIDMLPTER